MTEQLDWIEDIVNNIDQYVKGIPVLETINVSQLNNDTESARQSIEDNLNNLKLGVERNIAAKHSDVRRLLKVVDKRAENATLSEDFPETKVKETEGTRQASFKETLGIHINQVSNLLNAFA